MAVYLYSAVHFDWKFREIPVILFLAQIQIKYTCRQRIPSGSLEESKQKGDWEANSEKIKI